MKALEVLITIFPFLRTWFRRSLAGKIRRIRRMEQKGDITAEDAKRLIDQAYAEYPKKVKN